jgi:hypothetical protein
MGVKRKSKKKPGMGPSPTKSSPEKPDASDAPLRDKTSTPPLSPKNKDSVTPPLSPKNKDGVRGSNDTSNDDENNPKSADGPADSKHNNAKGDIAKTDTTADDANINKSATSATKGGKDKDGGGNDRNKDKTSSNPENKATSESNVNRSHPSENNARANSSENYDRTENNDRKYSHNFHSPANSNSSGRSECSILSSDFDMEGFVQSIINRTPGLEACMLEQKSGERTC